MSSKDRFTDRFPGVALTTASGVSVEAPLHRPRPLIVVVSGVLQERLRRANPKENLKYVRSNLDGVREQHSREVVVPIRKGNDG